MCFQKQWSFFMEMYLFFTFVIFIFVGITQTHNVMKKVILFALLALFALPVHARWFIGGNAAMWYDTEPELFTFTLLPEVGYEFNEKCAFGGQVGFTVAAQGAYSAGAGVIAPFFRYTFWSNDIVAFDLRATLGFSFSNVLVASEASVSPYVRFTPHEHFDVYLKLGSAGFFYAENNCRFGFGADTNNFALGCAYRF